MSYSPSHADLRMMSRRQSFNQDASVHRQPNEVVQLLNLSRYDVISGDNRCLRQMYRHIQQTTSSYLLLKLATFKDVIEAVMTSHCFHLLSNESN